MDREVKELLEQLWSRVNPSSTTTSVPRPAEQVAFIPLSGSAGKRDQIVFAYGVLSGLRAVGALTGAEHDQWRSRFDEPAQQDEAQMVSAPDWYTPAPVRVLRPAGSAVSYGKGAIRLERVELSPAAIRLGWEIELTEEETRLKLQAAARLGGPDQLSKAMTHLFAADASPELAGSALAVADDTGRTYRCRQLWSHFGPGWRRVEMLTWFTPAASIGARTLVVTWGPMKFSCELLE